MLRALGALFLVILIGAAVVFGGLYWMTRDARPIAEKYINTLFIDWNPEAFIEVSASTLKSDTKAMQSLQPTLAFMQQQLGPLKQHGALRERFGFRFGQAHSPSLFVYYQVDASFEKANPKIFLTLTRENSQWLVSHFWVEPIPMPN